MSISADSAMNPDPVPVAITDEHARWRSVAYALFSHLTASPNNNGSAASSLPPVDLPRVLSELQSGLPYRIDFSPLVAAAEGVTVRDDERLRDEYGSLFEVGPDGPPVPIREELARHKSMKVKEELVRFYDFFGYELQDVYEWAPDHLSIQLEFLHFLAYRESQASDAQEILSYRFAQRDFLDRHVLDWYEQVEEGVASHTASAYHRNLFAALGRFLRLDWAWQQNRLEGG